MDNGHLDFSPNWRKIVETALLPQIHELCDSVNLHIDDLAPYDTGALQKASYAEVNEEDASIQVGVHGEVPNPEGGFVGDYAKYVIDGHFTRGRQSYVEGNNYLDQAVENALIELRAKHE